MNKDIVINNDDFVFNFRVASVIRNKDKILVQVNKKAGHLTLPGGRCKFNEDTINTSIREFKGQLLYNKKSIKKAFENCGFMTIECFDGGPYIEKDNRDNFAFYKQTYYIGKRKEK